MSDRFGVPAMRVGHGLPDELQDELIVDKGNAAIDRAADLTETAVFVKPAATGQPVIGVESDRVNRPFFGAGFHLLQEPTPYSGTLHVRMHVDVVQIDGAPDSREGLWTLPPRCARGEQGRPA